MSVRKCELVTQIEYLPGGVEHWRDELEKNLSANRDIIKSWAYILHDKDLDENGNLKKPHIHLVLSLQESRQYTTIAGYFGVPPQFVSSIKQHIRKGSRTFADIGGALNYLTHRNAKDKYQYDDSEVVAMPGYNWQAERTKSEMAQAEWRTYSKLLKDIEDGKVRRFNLYQSVTMTTYIEHRAEIERAFQYREGQLLQNTDRKIEVIFITGEAGTGKTSLAKYLCKKRELSCCISGSSRDPFQNYGGQDAIILDDLRPETLPLSDLLKILDNHTASAASARYRDKTLEVSVIIITTVLSIEHFFGAASQGVLREPVDQLKRRCKSMIVLSRNAMCLYAYRASTKEYMLVGSGENPVASLFEKSDSELSEDDMKTMCSDLGIQYKPEGLPSDYLI